MPDIWTILGWLFYGAIRYVLYWIPLVKPFAVEISIPSSWWRYNGWDDWTHKDADAGAPDEHWLNSWFEMVVGEFRRMVIAEVKELVSNARQYVLGVIGGVQAGMRSVGEWIQKLDNWIGGWIPAWAETVTGGLNWLRDRLPDGIKHGWQSWQELWDVIKSSVREWVRARYDRFVSQAHDALAWVLGQGQTLVRWWDRVRDWIDRFRSNPYGYVVTLLGDAWRWLVEFRNRGRQQVLEWLGPDFDRLLTFGRDCVDFYYSLWSVGWRELGEFAENPREYLMDRIERAIVDRW